MRFLRPTVLSALALLAAGCTDQPVLDTAGPSPDQPAAPTAPRRATVVQNNFVHTNGADFFLNGKAFRHVGANVPELVYQPQWQILHELDFLESAGVRQVRVFLPNDAMQGDVWNPWETGNRLQFVLDQALARDIRVTVALAHNYDQGVWGWDGRGGKHIVYGDQGFYDRPFVIGKMLNDQWFDWGYKNNYKNFAWAIASRFKNHPGVFAWDIVNEANISNVSNAWLVDRQLAFYKDMAAMLKVADPNHMVTTGAISSHWLGLFTDARKDQLYADPNIDYVVVHEYNDWRDDNLNHQKDDIARANNRWRKPVVIEEFGLCASEYGTGAFDAVRTYFDRHYAGDATYQVDAIVQWGVTAYDDINTGNGSTDCSPVSQGKVLEYRSLWQRWAAELDRRNGGSNLATKLVQVVWRGNEKWTRRVPLNADRSPNFNAARTWVKEQRVGELPGSGDVQSYQSTTFPNRTIQESVWRNNQGFHRTIPLNVGGEPDWSRASGWTGPLAASGLPGAGSNQAQDDYVYPNQAHLMQSVWRGDQGFWRTVPFLNGSPNWGAASAWSAPIPVSANPGAGSLQTLDAIVYPNGATLMQSIWRGDQGYWRTVPIVNGAPNFGAASAWSGPSAPSALPGSGTIQGQGNYFHGLMR